MITTIGGIAIEPMSATSSTPRPAKRKRVKP
jgi:hypothetical protein